MATPLNAQNLMSIRKSCGLTQAQSAEKLQMSTRKYSDYENENIKTLLSDYQFHELSRTFKKHVHYFWAEIPMHYSAHFYPTKNFSVWAAYAVSGIFTSVKVVGSPSEKEFRQPLIDILKVTELDDASRPEKLSEIMEKRFQTEDNLATLFGGWEDLIGNSNKNLLVAHHAYALNKLDLNNEVSGYEWYIKTYSMIVFGGDESEKYVRNVQTFLDSDPIVNAFVNGPKEEYKDLQRKALPDVSVFDSGMQSVLMEPNENADFDEYQNEKMEERMRDEMEASVIQDEEPEPDQIDFDD